MNILEIRNKRGIDFIKKANQKNTYHMMMPKNG